MGRSVWMWALTALMACDGGGTDSTGGDDTDTTDDTDGGGSVENDLSLTEEATGDWSCFTPGTDFVSTTWLTQTLDPAKVTTLSLAGQVLDIPYRPDWRIPVVGIVVAVAALALIGWRVAEKILREPVVHGLRESQ